MSDGTSAQIFSTLFNNLADKYQHSQVSNVAATAQDIAVEMWAETFHYDFSHCDLECDATLIRLGLARRKRGGIQYRTRGLDGWEDA